MSGPVLRLALPAAVGDGVTSLALGELLLIAGLVTLVTPVPVRQGFWHVQIWWSRSTFGSIVVKLSEIKASQKIKEKDFEFNKKG